MCLCDTVPYLPPKCPSRTDLDLMVTTLRDQKGPGRRGLVLWEEDRSGAGLGHTSGGQGGKVVAMDGRRSHISIRVFTAFFHLVTHSERVDFFFL